MKLRLPIKLTAALIGAITTVGFALPQTYATVSWNGGVTRGDWFYTDNGKSGLVLTDDEHGQVNITAEGSNPVTAEISEVTVKDGATVRISGGNYLGRDRTFGALIVEDITAGDGTGSLLLSTQPYAAGKNPANTTATVKAVTGTLTGVQNYGVLTLGVDGTSSFDLTGAIVNNAGTVTLNGNYSFATSNANRYALREEGSFVCWTDVANQQGFKKTYGSTYYLIQGATVGAGFRATTTTGATVTEESSGVYYFTAGEVTVTSKFYVKADTAALEGVSDTGEFVVEKAGATVTVQDATFRDTSGSKNLNIVVGEGGVLEVTHSGSSGYVTGTLTINGGGTFRVVGEHDAFGWGGATTKGIILKGEDGKVATLDLQQTSSNSTTINAALKLMGYAAITGAKGFNTYNGCFYAEGVENTIENFQIRRDATFEVEEGGELTVGAMTKGQDGTRVLTKAGKGTITFTTEAQAGGLVIDEGKIVISGGTKNALEALTIATSGTLEISGGSTTVTGFSNIIGNTIALQAGSLSLTGSYDLSNLEIAGSIQYEGGTGIAVGSGFANASGTLNVVNITAGATLALTDATFNYKGSQVQVDNTTGDATLSGGTNYSALYVNNTGEVSYAAAQTIAEQHETNVTSVVLNATGATITMDTEASIALSMAASADTATVLATEDITLTRTEGPATGKTLTFSADGHTITVQGDNTYTGNVVVDKGTVKIDGGSMKKSLGAFNGIHSGPNTNRTITVNAGGTIDLNGTAEIAYVYTLNGGSLVNGTAIDSRVQTTGIKLTADSTVGGTGNFYLQDYDGATSSLDLAGHTLVKTGDNTFFLSHTTVTPGTIEVQEGIVHFYSNTSMSGDIVLAGGSVAGAIKQAADITIRSTAESGATFGATLQSGSYNLTFDTTTDLTVNTSLSSTSLIFKKGDGTLKAGCASAFGNGNIQVCGGKLDLSGYSIANLVNASGEVTIGNGRLNGDMTVDNATLTIDEDLTIGGELVVENANRIEVADGAVLYLTHTITNERSYIELAGKIDISAISGTEAERSYVGGDTQGNGFVQTGYEIMLIDYGMDAGFKWSEAEIYHSGSEVVKDDWGYVTYAVTDASTFYIFGGTESVSKAHSLDANTNVQMSSGTTLKVDEDISLDQIQAMGAATISIDSGKELSGYTSSMNLTLEGAGVYALDSRISLGSLALGNDWTGTVRLAGTANSVNFNSMARAGSWLELKGFSGYQDTPTGTTSANIILTDNEDGAAAFTATYGYSYDYGYTMKFTGAIKGEGTFVANAGSNRYENYEFAGDISGWSGEFRYASGRNTKLTISGNAHEVNAAIDGASGLTLCVNTSATFNEAVGVNGLTLNNSSANFNDAFQVNGSISASGTSSLAMGEGQTLSLGAAIANSGNLTLSGTFDVSGRANVLIGSDYSGGVTPGNGFGVSTYGVQVVQNSGSATLDWSAAEIVYDTPGYEKRADGYIVQGVNDGLFHVMTGTESVSTAQNAAEEAGITMLGIELNNGTTLIVDKGFSTAQISLVSGSAVLNVKTAVTLLSDGADHTGLSLSGNGMYKLAAGSSTPDINWTSNDWHGTVMLTDAAKQDWNLNDFGHAGSKVELDGISGNFARPNVCGEIVPTLVLVGDGVTVTACYTNSTYTFSGGVEGNGNWTYVLSTTTFADNQTYLFTGDVSNWTGAYVSMTDGKTSTLQFQGAADVMGAAIMQTAGTINVEVGNGTNAHTTTFANTVEASSLTVQKHATAILGGDTTITDRLTLHGLLKTAGGSLSLGDHAAVQIGTAMSMEANKGGEINVSDNTAIEAAKMYGTDDKGVLNNVNVDILDDYTIENMSISGSLIDVGEGTKLYLVNVDIHSDTHITDEAAWLDMQATNAWLDENNAHVMGRHVTTEDTTLYLSGDPSQAITMAAGRVVVELTSDMFDTVTMTGGEPGVDLWLDMTAIADAFEGADYVALDFRNLAREFSNAMVDVEKLQVNVSLDGETYKQAYAMTDHGTTTTLYFSVPEPTTSTLSLLALAALAARKRRKA